MTNPSLGDLIRRCHEQVAWFIQPVSLRSAEPPYRNLPEDAMFTALVELLQTISPDNPTEVLQAALLRVQLRVSTNATAEQLELATASMSRVATVLLVVLDPTNDDLLDAVGEMFREEDAVSLLVLTMTIGEDPRVTPELIAEYAAA